MLVHGAWVGEWSWLPILPRLRASGRPIHPVSLTGHGARSHQSGPHVGLSDHVADVVGLIRTLDLDDVTLVGHSYGGRVITGAVAEIGDRVRRMIFLDAHTPVADTPPQPANRLVVGGMVPFQGYDPTPELVGSEEAVVWFNARTMPQSAKCFSDPWQRALPDHVEKTFVFAAGEDNSRFATYAEVCRADPTWRYEELPGPHFLMMSHPEEITDIIL